MNTDFKLSVEFGVDISEVEKQLKKVQKAFDKVIKGIDKTVDKATDDISDQFEDMADDIEDSFDDIEDNFEGSTKKIVKTTEDTTKKVSKKFDDMVDDATDNFNNLDSKFSKATNSLKSTADKAVNAISNSFDSIANLSIGSGMDSNFSRATSGMISTSESIASRIRANFSNITSGLSTQFSRISSSLKTATGDMPNIASNIVAGVNAKMRRIAGKAKDDFSKIENYFDTGTDKIIPTAKKVTSRTSQEFSKLSSKSKNEFNSIGGSFKKAFNQVQDESKDAVNKMEQHFKKIPNAVVTHWGKTTTVLSGHISKWEKLWHKFVAKVMNGAIGIKDGIVSAFKTASSKISSALSSLKGDSSSTFNKIENDADDAADKMADDFKDSGSKIESVFDGIKGKLAGIATAVIGAFGVSAISGFIDETRELNKELGKVMFSLSQKGLSKTDISGAYSKVFAVIGDEGRTGETIQNLGSVTGTKKELEDLAELVTDVHLTLGERVTPEALAESIALTTQLGEIDGNLSDALAQCGISTDDFNDKLANCTSQQQRLAMITTALSGTFAGATDAYAKANPEMYALNEAIGKNQLSFMNLGNVLSPLKTKFLNEFLTPLYEWLAEKLPSAINTVLGWFDNLKSKLSEVNWSKWLEDLKEIGGYISGTLSGVWNGLETNLIEIASAFGIYNEEQVAGKGMKFFKKFFKWTEEHSSGIANAITIIGGALAGAKIASSISAIAEAISLLLIGNPIGLIAFAIGGLITAIIIFGDEITDFCNKVMKPLEDFGGKIGETFDGWYDKYFKGALEGCGKFLRGEYDWQDKVGKVFDDIVGSAGDFITNFKKAIASNEVTKGIYNAFAKMINAPIKAVILGVRGIISGINWVLEKVGSPDQLPKPAKDAFQIDLLAKGTNNWKGGKAIVGEKGTEAVFPKGGKPFLTSGATLLDLPQGSQVLPNRLTKRLIGSGVPAFGDGLNIGGWFKDIFEYITNPSDIIKDLLANAMGSFGDGGGMNFIVTAIKSWFTNKFTSFSKIGDWIKDKFSSFMPDTANISGVENWKPLVLKAASFFGEKLTDNELARVLQQIKTESGGNQKAVQSLGVWDINAQTGNLARGLLQYVPSTFNGYKVSGFGDINNGYHQLLAFFNNSSWRKALPQLGEIRGWTPRGKRRMANGGIVTKPTNALIGEAGYNEAVVPLTASKVKPFGESVVNSLLDMVGISGGGEQEIIVNVPVYLDSTLIGKSTAKVVKSEIDKMDKRSNRMNGMK